MLSGTLALVAVVFAKTWLTSVFFFLISCIILAKVTNYNYCAQPKHLIRTVDVAKVLENSSIFYFSAETHSQT